MHRHGVRPETTRHTWLYNRQLAKAHVLHGTRHGSHIGSTLGSNKHHANVLQRHALPMLARRVGGPNPLECPQAEKQPDKLPTVLRGRPVSSEQRLDFHQTRDRG